jgi:hypothetical protein
LEPSPKHRPNVQSRLLENSASTVVLRSLSTGCGVVLRQPAVRACIIVLNAVLQPNLTPALERLLDVVCTAGVAYCARVQRRGFCVPAPDTMGPCGRSEPALRKPRPLLDACVAAWRGPEERARCQALSHLHCWLNMRPTRALCPQVPGIHCPAARSGIMQTSRRLGEDYFYVCGCQAPRHHTASSSFKQVNPSIAAVRRKRVTDRFREVLRIWA